MLEQLSVDDEDLDLVLAVYKDDPDLLPWVPDVHWQQSIILTLGFLEQQWNERRSSLKGES
jgi:hypothetical protein